MNTPNPTSSTDGEDRGRAPPAAARPNRGAGRCAEAGQLLELGAVREPERDERREPPESSQGAIAIEIDSTPASETSTRLATSSTSRPCRFGVSSACSSSSQRKACASGTWSPARSESWWMPVRNSSMIATASADCTMRSSRGRVRRVR